MKRIGRVLLWLICGIALLLCCLLIATNLYVQSQGVHRRIQQELSERLDTPLRLRQISITPWNGLTLKGISIPQEPGKIAGNFLEAQSFQLQVKFLSLFRDRLVIRRVSLIGPQVVWAQNSAGKWRLPQMPHEKKEETKAPPIVAATTTPAKASMPAESAKSAQASVSLSSPTPASTFVPEVQRVTLKNGNFTFLDSHGDVIAKFLGLDFHSIFRTATAIKGNASVEHISLRDRFFLDHLESPLHYDPSQLAFSSISTHAADGLITGRFEMQLQAQDTPFTAEVRFRDLEADKLMTNAGGPSGIIQGHVEGFLNATGETADPNALTGRGEITLRDGKLQQYSLLVALGQILQIDELMQLQLQQAEAKYHISPGVVVIDELLLRSPNIRLTGTGTVTFSGRLHLDAQLALNDKIRRQLFAPLRENFEPISGDADYAALNFKVSGTVERPKTDLMEKLVGRDLRDLSGMIGNLFGRAKKKKTRPEVSPSPTPAISPNENPTESPGPAATAAAMPNEATIPASPTP